MRTEKILTALRRLKVETGSLACMGCGREHDCGVHGCHIMRDAAELIEKLTDRCARYAEEIAVLQEREKWVPVTERLPEVWRNDETSELVNYMIYSPDFGVDIGNYHANAKKWLCMALPCTVTHWRPLPDGPEVEENAETSDLTKVELLQVMEMLAGSAEYELRRALIRIEMERNDAHYEKSRRLIDEEEKHYDAYFSIMRPYKGKPIMDVPPGVLKQAKGELDKAVAAGKEWNRLNGIKGRRAENG